MRHDWLKCLTLLTLLLFGVACQNRPEAAERPLQLSAIPDQDPEKLQRLYGALADYLSKAVGHKVEYKPVTDYKASVTAFKVGDLDLVWFGGLTGVQARLQVPQSTAIVQRDIDEKFESVFIANRGSGITTLSDLKGKTFTFGSESSTSGRLMPQFFLEKAQISLADLKGRPGFSGSHDKTIELVTAGSYDAGVLNRQVWEKRLATKTVDTSKVMVIANTPPYHDYHWVLHPGAVKRFGPELTGKLVAAFKALSTENPEHAKVLDLFGAERFIETRNENYAQIEDVGRKVGLIVHDAAHAQR